MFLITQCDTSNRIGKGFAHPGRIGLDEFLSHKYFTDFKIRTDGQEDL